MDKLLLGLYKQLLTKFKIVLFYKLLKDGDVMADFLDTLNKIKTGAQLAQAIQPDIMLFSQDHQNGTVALLQDAGASVATFSGDTGVQNEAMASAQLAASLVPLAFSFFSMFHKAKHPTVAPIIAPSGVVWGAAPVPTVHGDK